MTAAPFLAPPARPPHDPLWMQLGGTTGWPHSVSASAIEVEPDGCALVLSRSAGTERTLSEASGSLGGLVLPRNYAVDYEGAVWVLSRTSGLLKRFDVCNCCFVAAPCTGGIGDGARQLVQPAGIAIDDTTIFVCDAGPPGRVLLFDRRSFALRAIWAPPPGSTANPWSPRAIAVDGAAVYVADPNNGGVHRFARWGGWLGLIAGLGAVETLAINACGQLFAVVPGQPTVTALTLKTGGLSHPAGPEEVRPSFAALPFPVSAHGIVDLSAACPSLTGTGFDEDGSAVALPPLPDPAFASTGTWVSARLDSGIDHCVWHRLCVDAELSAHQTVRFDAYTADVPLPDDAISLLPSSAWSPLPSARGGEDSLFMTPPGRFMWLRVTLDGDGRQSPRLCGVFIEYPRISLRRYLPAAFGSDPQSADFTDRLLAIFDRGFRDIETRIDDRAMLFDADSAPANSGQDVLSWIASWLGIALERGWPEPKRRAIVKSAGKLFACRGTVKGLRDTLLLWLGWDHMPKTQRLPACGPRCRPPARMPVLPTLILEHWKLRRWLWLGKGRLGSDATLWGESLLGRSQLGTTARAGVTRLDTTRNPLADPFNQAANRFSIFLPAKFLSQAQMVSQLNRLIDEHRPADALPILVPVHARMRIGIQACIGFDSVIGCWPSGVTLDQARLGRGTVISGENTGGVTARIGRTARLQPSRFQSATRNRECLV